MGIEIAFWQAALGVEFGGDPGGFVSSRPQQGRSRLSLQKVPESKTIKNRVHVDLEVENLDAGVRQLEQLGATIVRPKPDKGFQWVVMADPEGNEFCVSA